MGKFWSKFGANFKKQASQTSERLVCVIRLEIAEVRMAETGPMNYFKVNYKTDRRIDHVFLSPHFKALDYKLMTYSYWVEVEPGVHEQRLPSDHYPIGVHVTMKN